MRPRVYIDGHVGTTGLRIREWLAGRGEIELLTLSQEQRKDASARREQLRSADLVVLCLPDDAARETVTWVKDSGTRIIDASTAHRVADDWVFGLPELQPGQRDAIRKARFVSNPGCYSSAFILLVRPLIDAGLVAPDAPITVHALSGYSGGGRPLIEKWEDPMGGLLSLVYEAPYALERVHKHVPEMVRYSGLAHQPYFEPAVGPFRCGMRVQIPLHTRLLNGFKGREIWNAFNSRYRDEPFVRVVPFQETPSFDDRSFDPQACNDTNRIDLHVLPHPSGHVLLMAILDNLGKGASGVAIQNLNLMLGLDEKSGLPR
ncbi:MAG TPA: N-acetyl-gamma-glutamyl-phosphate reductase [Candidatus Acidoferrales bacterium]|nr:N-acetyl-gamma-glutamyl-phosphate reductase [Candidatus Acidoferrales bacterium]